MEQIFLDVEAHAIIGIELDLGIDALVVDEGAVGRAEILHRYPIVREREQCMLARRTAFDDLQSALGAASTLTSPVIGISGPFGSFLSVNFLSAINL